MKVCFSVYADVFDRILHDRIDLHAAVKEEETAASAALEAHPFCFPHLSYRRAACIRPPLSKTGIFIDSTPEYTGGPVSRVTAPTCWPRIR
jgi:hypothetical protein